MLPPVQEKLLVPFPPVIPFAVAVPSERPLQLTLSILIEPIANTSGSNTSMLPVVLHPF